MGGWVGGWVEEGPAGICDSNRFWRRPSRVCACVCVYRSLRNRPIKTAKVTRTCRSSATASRCPTRNTSECVRVDTRRRRPCTWQTSRALPYATTVFGSRFSAVPPPAGRHFILLYLYIYFFSRRVRVCTRTTPLYT